MAIDDGEAIVSGGETGRLAAFDAQEQLHVVSTSGTIGSRGRGSCG